MSEETKDKETAEAGTGEPVSAETAGEEPQADSPAPEEREVPVESKEEPVETAEPEPRPPPAAKPARVTSPVAWLALFLALLTLAAVGYMIVEDRRTRAVEAAGSQSLERLASRVDESRESLSGLDNSLDELASSDEALESRIAGLQGEVERRARRIQGSGQMLDEVERVGRQQGIRLRLGRARVLGGELDGECPVQIDHGSRVCAGGEQRAEPARPAARGVECFEAERCGLHRARPRPAVSGRVAPRGFTSFEGHDVHEVLPAPRVAMPSSQRVQSRCTSPAAAVKAAGKAPLRTPLGLIAGHAVIKIRPRPVDEANGPGQGTTEVGCGLQRAFEIWRAGSRWRSWSRSRRRA